MASGNPIWSLVWFLILIFISFPVAGFCAGWYILILPFTVCIDGLTVSEFYYLISIFLSFYSILFHFIKTFWLIPFYSILFLFFFYSILYSILFLLNHSSHSSTAVYYKFFTVHFIIPIILYSIFAIFVLIQLRPNFYYTIFSLFLVNLHFTVCIDGLTVSQFSKAYTDTKLLNFLKATLSQK